MVDPLVQRLVDESDIKKLIIQISFAMDLRDREMFKSAFADEIECDITLIAGDSVPLSGKMKSVELADNVIKMLSEFAMTQHLNTMQMIEVSGDDATLTSYVLGTHYLAPAKDRLSTHYPDPWSTIGARYDMRVRRLPQGWRFIAFKWRIMWTRDNHDVWNEIDRRLAAT